MRSGSLPSSTPWKLLSEHSRQVVLLCGISLHPNLGIHPDWGVDLLPQSPGTSCVSVTEPEGDRGVNAGHGSQRSTARRPSGAGPPSSCPLKPLPHLPSGTPARAQPGTAGASLTPQVKCCQLQEDKSALPTALGGCLSFGHVSLFLLKFYQNRAAVTQCALDPDRRTKQGSGHVGLNGSDSPKDARAPPPVFSSGLHKGCQHPQMLESDFASHPGTETPAQPSLTLTPKGTGCDFLSLSAFASMGVSVQGGREHACSDCRWGYREAHQVQALGPLPRPPAQAPSQPLLRPLSNILFIISGAFS